MSEVAQSGGTGLNWRGPLLAAAIFAGLFGLLLLMAHQNESNVNDEGSSLREDPYGTSLLFDAYQRAGYHVQRSQDKDDLAAQDASQTTAFFIGGQPDNDVQIDNGNVRLGEQFRGRLEDFLARGGRVVLIQPMQDLALKSKSQGWQVEEEWKEGHGGSGLAWLAPDLSHMPAGSEPLYIGSDAPWLDTDSSWVPLYVKPPDPADESPSDAIANVTPRAHVYMEMRRVGKGQIIAASQEVFVLNEAIKTHPDPVLLDFLAGGRPVIFVDETLHGLQQEQGVLWLVHRYRLQTALLLFWATLLALLWSMSGDLVRRPGRDRMAEIVRQGQGAGVAAQRLLQRSVPAELVAVECWGQFRHRSPQDAEAISNDPRWRPRLRAALALPPLAGYKELALLIAERRAAAKGLAHGAKPAQESSLSSTTIFKEARSK